MVGLLDGVGDYVNDEEGVTPEFDNKNSLKIPKLNDYAGFLNDYPCISPS